MKEKLKTLRQAYYSAYHADFMRAWDSYHNKEKKFLSELSAEELVQVIDIANEEEPNDVLFNKDIVEPVRREIDSRSFTYLDMRILPLRDFTEEDEKDGIGKYMYNYNGTPDGWSLEDFLKAATDQLGEETKTDIYWVDGCERIPSAFDFFYKRGATYTFKKKIVVTTIKEREFTVKHTNYQQALKVAEAYFSIDDEKTFPKHYYVPLVEKGDLQRTRTGQSYLYDIEGNEIATQKMPDS